MCKYERVGPRRRGAPFQDGLRFGNMLCVLGPASGGWLLLCGRLFSFPVLAGFLGGFLDASIVLFVGVLLAGHRLFGR